jgi:hypothetical protein
MGSRTDRWSWPWWAGALVLMAAAFYTAHLLIPRSPPPSPPPSRMPAPYSRISFGMTYAQVVGVLGRPAERENYTGGSECVWLPWDGVFSVEFANDLVTSTHWQGPTDPPPNDR